MRKDLKDTEKRKHRKGLCIVHYCGKHTKKRENGTYPLKCSACRRREWAEKNPEKYLYGNLKGNARRRGKVFTITLEQFKEFLKEENYLERVRGRGKHCISVDRVDNSKGYEPGNLKAVTVSDNSIKRNYVDYFRQYYYVE